MSERRQTAKGKGTHNGYGSAEAKIANSQAKIANAQARVDKLKADIRTYRQRAADANDAKSAENYTRMVEKAEGKLKSAEAHLQDVISSAKKTENRNAQKAASKEQHKQREEEERKASAEKKAENDRKCDHLNPKEEKSEEKEKKTPSNTEKEQPKGEQNQSKEESEIGDEEFFAKENLDKIFAILEVTDFKDFKCGFKTVNAFIRAVREKSSAADLVDDRIRIVYSEYQKYLDDQAKKMKPQDQKKGQKPVAQTPATEKPATQGQKGQGPAKKPQEQKPVAKIPNTTEWSEECGVSAFSDVRKTLKFDPGKLRAVRIDRKQCS